MILDQIKSLFNDIGTNKKALIKNLLIHNNNNNNNIFCLFFKKRLQFFIFFINYNTIYKQVHYIFLIKINSLWQIYNNNK